VTKEQESTTPETPPQLEARVAALANEQIIINTTTLLIDRLLILTGNDVTLVEDLIGRIAGLAKDASQLTLAQRRIDTISYSSETNRLNPNNMSLKEEIAQYGQKGAEPIRATIDLVKERAEIVAQGKSRLQRKKSKRSRR